LRKEDKLLTQLDILARQCDDFELFVQRINCSRFFIPHPVRRIRKRCNQSITQARLNLNIRHRTRHALHPLVTLAGTYRKRQVPRTQSRMPERIGVHRWAAKPAC
jgi:hypothetical protein